MLLGGTTLAQLLDARNLATPTAAPDVDAAEAEGVRRG